MLTQCAACTCLAAKAGRPQCVSSLPMWTAGVVNVQRGDIPSDAPIERQAGERARSSCWRLPLLSRAAPALSFQLAAP